MTSAPKLAFVSLSDPSDKKSWSGTNYYMLDALRRRFGNVDIIVPPRPWHFWHAKLLDAVARILVGKRYPAARSTLIARSQSRHLERAIKAERYDAVVVCSASAAIAYGRPLGVPILYVADTTFALLTGYYDNVSDYLPFALRAGHVLAQRALQRADVVSYPSQWAKKSAMQDYGIPSAKIHVIPFGANLDQVPPRESVLNRTAQGPCKLLFLGVDWERKGGDLAVATLDALKSQHGIEAELVVCGCQPPSNRRRDRMRIVGFLDKNKPDEYSALHKLFEECHFLLLPTRKECYGLVFAEASAYGMPSIGTDTGGVSGVVRDQVNGYLLPEDASGSDYADAIARIWSDPQKYQALVHTTRSEFDTCLNWDAWADAVSKLLPHQA